MQYTLKIDGEPIGWAITKVESGEMKITDVVIRKNYQSRIGIVLGVTSRDLGVNAEPREAGFYRYSQGSQTMMFLLKDNRETNEFLAAEDIPVTMADWQWHVISDNGKMDQCDWGYIEQALVGGNQLVKI